MIEIRNPKPVIEDLNLKFGAYLLFGYCDLVLEIKIV